MKYKERNFFQISHVAIEILNENKVSTSAKWLYTVLCKLENRFTGQNEDFFFRSIRDLEKDSNLSGKTIIDAIKELVRIELIQNWQMHWEDKETGKKSQKHISAFRILDENL